MNRFIFRASLLICVSVIASSAMSTESINTPLEELIANPEKFEGRRVAVVGYLDTTEAHTCDLRATRERPHDIRRLVNVELPQPNDPAVKRLTNQYTRVVRVRLVGIFHYKKVGPIKSTPVTGDPHVKAIITMQTGFGWMGLYDKQLTDISEFGAAPGNKK